MTFYAAVHATNAYLWETQRYEPANHTDRRNAVKSSPMIGSCFFSYRALSEVGFYARYDETFSTGEHASRRLLNIHFRRIEATLMQALGQPAPVW